MNEQKIPDEHDLDRVEILLPDEIPILERVGRRFPGLRRDLRDFWGGGPGPEIHAVSVVPRELLEGVADFTAVVGLLAVTEKKEDARAALTLFSFYTRHEVPEDLVAQWEWWAFPLSSDRMDAFRLKQYEEALLTDFRRRVLYAIHTRENKL